MMTQLFIVDVVMNEHPNELKENLLFIASDTFCFYICMLMWE